MAHVTLSPLISSLSGTIGDMTFRTRNGQTSVFQKNPPRLPANATRKQKAKYKKQLIVDQCIKILQDEIEDILVAISRRQAIKKKVEYWYDKLAPKIKAKTKLQGAIIDACRTSLSAIESQGLTTPSSSRRPMPPLSPKTSHELFGDPQNVSRLDRDFLENGSEKLEKSRSAIGSQRDGKECRLYKRLGPQLSPNEKNGTQREVK